MADTEGFAILDVLYPFAGPCGFCGGPDKRHRLADALVEAYRAGDSVDLLVRAYEWPEAVNERSILTLVEHAERNRKRRRYRWNPIPARSDPLPRSVRGTAPALLT